MENINWGIIGTGNIARTFAAALNGTDGAVLYAAASRTKEKADRFSAEFGAVKSYGSYAELASDKNIDIVYIATPMASHYEDAKLCLMNGLNVLCEKSVTLNRSQLMELLGLAKENGLFFMEAMWMKCRPTYLKAKEWVNSGRIGDIRYIHADFCNIVRYDADSRLFRPDCGGGAILDLGVYPLTLAEDFLGFPYSIESAANVSRGIDLSNSILLKYQDGSFASVESGFELASRNNAVISGTNGMIAFGDWFHCTCDATLFNADRNEAETFSQPNAVNGYEYEIIEAQRCLREGLLESPLVPHSGTLNVMTIMDECRRQWGLVFPGE
ncbi:MAG: Gfo/Idh/MocA family oxidoreductase [Ruminococcus sp.]|nr:Gfo/Idh/MocA family oxidoreductase [Ruminococcus sp.]